MKDDIEILPYSEGMAGLFYEINHEWISEMFQMEDVDEKILKNPDECIISKGGFIWFAKHHQHGIVGTCALKKTGDSQFEFTKMGVLKKARGLNVGKRLLQHVIEFVKNSNIETCYLLTNHKCEAAIHLYEQNGFVHDAEIKATYIDEYERSNVAMKLI